MDDAKRLQELIDKDQRVRSEVGSLLDRVLTMIEQIQALLPDLIKEYGDACAAYGQSLSNEDNERVDKAWQKIMEILI
jgi:hypothetical protein